MTSVLHNKVVITGASSGIGAATASYLASMGARVVLGARRTERLEKLVATIVEAGGDAICTRVDVTSHADVKTLADLAVEHYGHLDVMINNAGLMAISSLAALRVDEWERMIDVNIKGVLYGIAAALPIFERQRRGHMINVASIAGHKVNVGGAVYSGTKFAVRAISEGLRQEASHVRCTVISPGAVDTELFDGSSDPKTISSLQKIYSNSLPADRVARAIAYAIEQPDNVAINEIVIRPKDSSL